MVDRVAADHGFAQAWHDWAAQFASGPQTAIGLMKANVLDAQRLTLGEAVAIESERMVASSRTADHREAVHAWVEKREPIFGRSE